MTELRRFWVRLYAAFDPGVAVRDPALFAARPPGYEPLEPIGRRLRLGDYKALIAGAAGSGKSSSLYELGRSLCSERPVVLVDMFDYYQRHLREPSALATLDPSDLLAILGLALLRVGEEHLDRSSGTGCETIEKAAGIGASETLPVGTNVVGPPGTPLASDLVELGTTRVESVRGALLLGKNLPRPSERAIFDAINDTIVEFEVQYGQRLLLLVDGLDRVVDSAPLDALFGDSSLLYDLACDAVFVAPQRFLGEGNLSKSRFDIFELANVPVLDRHHPDDPNKLGPGLVFFDELVERRLEAVRSQITASLDPDHPIPSRVVARLAFYSGGVVRSFMRMIRMAVEQTWDDDTIEIVDATVDATVQEMRRLMSQRLGRGDLALLRGVMRDPEHLYPDDPRAHELSQSGRLLAYSDDTVWYYPHPLLILLLRPHTSEAREELGAQLPDDWELHAWTMDLQNWRRFEFVEFGPDGVCLLAGPNGSGKSSILEALDFLRNVSERGVMEACRLARGGRFIRRLEARQGEPVVVSLALGPLRWRVELAIEGGGIHPNHGESLVYQDRTIFERKLYANEWALDDRVWDASHPRSSLRVAFDSGDYDFLEPLRVFLSSIRVYPPFVLRDVHGIDQHLAQTTSLDRDGSNLIATLHRWKTASRRHGGRFEWIIEQMRRAFPDQVEDIELRPDGQLVQGYVYAPEAKADQAIPLHLVADGVLTGLLHLTAAAGAERGSVLAIDELENHLHPQAIRAILQAMRELAQERDCTIVLTTHSPVLMTEFKGHEDQVFVLEPGLERTPQPLDEIRDPEWLAHFALGQLYSRLKFAAPRRLGD